MTTTTTTSTEEAANVEEQYTKMFELTKKYQQEHLFNFWSILNLDEKLRLLKDLEEIRFEELQDSFERALEEFERIKENLDEFLEPPPAEICGSWNDSDRQKYENIGLEMVRQGKVAVLLMAGGQGTRLGVKHPKGMFNVGLPSNKSLYQLQAERLLKLQRLALKQGGKQEAVVNNATTTLGSIPWYIMTSEHTQIATEQFFVENNHFHLNGENIIFFEQNTLPALTKEGKIILESKNHIAKAPDGNGGLYRVLRDRGILEDMQRRGIEHIHVYGVDNILVRMCDPAFIGFCIDKGAECGAKCVEKVDPHEAVGIIGLVRGKYQVIEYSEILKSTAELRVSNENGAQLVYHHGNICNHYFTRTFLERVCATENERQLPQHVAIKKVTTIDLSTGDVITPIQPNAIKMEKFVFDVFPFAKTFAVWQVIRDREFSPLKNGNDASKDCPKSCRADLLRHHAVLLQEAGVEIPKNVVVEISPLVSYDGEGLKNILLMEDVNNDDHDCGGEKENNLRYVLLEGDVQQDNICRVQVLD